MAYLALGNGVVQPDTSTQEAMKRAADQVKHGEIPTISLNPKGFAGISEYKLDTVCAVELGIIGSALIGVSLASYLLKASLSFMPGLFLNQCLGLLLLEHLDKPSKEPSVAHSTFAGSHIFTLVQ